MSAQREKHGSPLDIKNFNIVIKGDKRQVTIARIEHKAGDILPGYSFSEDRLALFQVPENE